MSQPAKESAANRQHRHRVNDDQADAAAFQQKGNANQFPAGIAICKTTEQHAHETGGEAVREEEIADMHAGKLLKIRSAERCETRKRIAENNTTRKGDEISFVECDLAEDGETLLPFRKAARLLAKKKGDDQTESGQHGCCKKKSREMPVREND